MRRSPFAASLLEVLRLYNSAHSRHGAKGKTRNTPVAQPLSSRDCGLFEHSMRWRRLVEGSPTSPEPQTQAPSALGSHGPMLERDSESLRLQSVLVSGSLVLSRLRVPDFEPGMARCALSSPLRGLPWHVACKDHVKSG